MTLDILGAVQEYTVAAPHSPTASVLGKIGIGVMLLGGLCSMFPLWKSATLSPDSIERRTYWTGSALAVVLFFLSALPDWRSSLFVSLAMGLALVAVAGMWTNHVKINGRIYAGLASNRDPDRPPALADKDDG